MVCRDVQRLCTAYVDGELDERRASAVRGHMRTCDSCLVLVQDEAAIASAAETLELAEPPPQLWSRIEHDLGQREIADSRRSAWWLAWPRMRQAMLPAAVVAAAALAVVSYGLRQGEAPSSQATAPAAPERVVQSAPSPAAVSPVVPAPSQQFRAVRSGQIRDAERTYLKTIMNLEGLVAEARTGWNPQQTGNYRRAMAGYRSELRAARNLLASSGTTAAVDTVAHDPLFAVYQGRIRFLQRVSFGEAL